MSSMAMTTSPSPNSRAPHALLALYSRENKRPAPVTGFRMHNVSLAMDPTPAWEEPAASSAIVIRSANEGGCHAPPNDKVNQTPAIQRKQYPRKERGPAASRCSPDPGSGAEPTSCARICSTTEPQPAGGA